ncbi:MAG: DUF1501 domain-containing protein [Saprospiraceae bacterium]|nr:DUF1501 domain-containing protein [Saprospiraceae bacterium]
MKRRKFLRTAGLATAMAPFAYNGFSINPMSPKSLFQKLGASVNINGKIMVFIELNGGNDGINTLPPIDQYSKLSVHRPRVLIPENQVLPLSGVSGTGLHPAMSEVREMFDDGMVSVVQTVGYPNQDYSHFRSMDIWMTGADSDEVLYDGWLGRMLDQEYPGYPTGYPNLDAPDPLAINVGTVAPLSLMGPAFPMGISVGNPEEVYNLINDFIEPAPNSPYGEELTYIRQVMQYTKVYFDVIKEAAQMGANLSSLYPAEGENNLADQLKVVARLINGGLETPVYLVSIGGFDTHSEQVEAGTPTVGLHAELLQKISKAVYAFMDDIQLMGKSDAVCAMTYSEFGRTIADNLSFGTDHGAGAPLFVFGKGVNPGIIGANPNIPLTLDVSADVPMQHDFRQVYASVIQDWFGVPNSDDLLFGNFSTLPIFKAGSSGTKDRPGRNVFGVGNFPNPVHAASTITFSIPSANVVITLLDGQGRTIRKIAEGQYPAGTHKVVFQRDGLPAGTYYYMLKVNGLGVTKKMLIL